MSTEFPGWGKPLPCGGLHLAMHPPLPPACACQEGCCGRGHCGQPLPSNAAKACCAQTNLGWLEPLGWHTWHWAGRWGGSTSAGGMGIYHAMCDLKGTVAVGTNKKSLQLTSTPTFPRGEIIALTIINCSIPPHNPASQHTLEYFAVNREHRRQRQMIHVTSSFVRGHRIVYNYESSQRQERGVS